MASSGQFFRHCAGCGRTSHAYSARACVRKDLAPRPPEVERPSPLSRLHNSAVADAVDLEGRSGAVNPVLEAAHTAHRSELVALRGCIRRVIHQIGVFILPQPAEPSRITGGPRNAERLCSMSKSWPFGRSTDCCNARTSLAQGSA
jgi:hypothetical protein